MPLCIAYHPYHFVGEVLLHLVYSHLNYGILVWGNHCNNNKLFILQKKAVRIIYRASFKSHCRPLFIGLGILTLPSMFVISCILYVKENIKIVICYDPRFMNILRETKVTYI